MVYKSSSGSGGGGGGSGTVTQINTGTGLTGGPITSSGTVSVADSTANSLAGYNNSGTFSDVIVGSGLSLVAGTLTASGGGGGIGGSTGSVDNSVLRADGTGGATLQSSAVIIADTTGVISGTQGVTFTGSSSGTTALVPTAAASGTITMPAVTGTMTVLGNTTTGTGSIVLATSPTLVTPVIGAATGTSLQLSGLTASSALATDASKNLVSVTNTGTGNNVLATSPTLVTPDLGTPTTLVGTNITGTAASFTAGAATVANTVSSANEATDTTCFPLFITASGTQSLQPKNNTTLIFNSNTGALGATSFSGAGSGLTGTAASLTAGAVAVVGITGLGTGVATFLATPSSANLATAVTDETGTGALVFANTPTLVTPVIGAATGTSLQLSGLTASAALATDGSKNLVSVTNTGTGNNVLATSPTLTTPTLGVASATTINKVTLTAPATGSTLTVADGVTLTAPTTTNVLVISGTAKLSVGTATPTSPATGDLWCDTN